MSVERTWLIRLLPLLLLLPSGCRTHEVAFPSWTAALPNPEPNPTFTELMKLGQLAEAGAPQLLVRTDFFPVHKRRAGAVCGPLLTRLAHLQRAPIPFVYRPPGLTMELPGRRGWRLLGRVLTWQIEEAVTAKAWPRAIERWRMATRFGFDLTGGGAADATLGLAIADEARRALTPALHEMPPAALETLATSAEAVLRVRPPLTRAVRHEAMNMRKTLQLLQDAFAAGTLKQTAAPLGASAADDVDRLEKLGREKGAAVFRSIGSEIEEIERELVEDTRRPARARKWEFESGPVRGRMFRRAIVGGLDSLLGMNDATLARTRLLVAECRLRALPLRGQSLPARLKEICPQTRTDPYSGEDLIYRRDGKEWAVYSVGANLKDDGGQTDAANTAPDLRLER